MMKHTSQEKAKPLLFSPTTGTHSCDVRTPVEYNHVDIQMGFSGKKLFMNKNARFHFQAILWDPEVGFLRFFF